LVEERAPELAIPGLLQTISIVKRSVPSRDRSRSRSPQEIEADLEDALPFLTVDWERSSKADDAGASAEEVVRVVAKAVKVITRRSR
jgi:hypothetical protein